MPARRPVRPPPGHAMLLPRVTDDASQRAFDHVKQSVQSAAATTAAVQTQVDDQAGGRRLAEIELTATGSGRLSDSTTRVHVRMVGGGGGGGGAQGGANQAAGAGGSSGVHLEFWADVTPGGPYSWTAPIAGGTAGSSAGGNGGAGPDAALTLPTAGTPTPYTAKGGGGGQGMLNGTTMLAQPTAPAAGSSSGPGIRSTWTPGGHGINLTQPFWWGGNGAASPLGAGSISGNDGTGTGAGVAGGPGGGGSGATEKPGGAGKAGGAGGGALIVMEEWS